MGKEAKCKGRFRVALQAVRDDVRGNCRRQARGSACVEIGMQYGEVLLTVENLRYLGTTPDGRPYFYEGWMILSNGCRIDMGPISTDGKGNGKDYWRFVTAAPDTGGIAAGDIAGFVVSVAAPGGRENSAELVVLAGMLMPTVPGPLIPGYTAAQGKTIPVAAPEKGATDCRPYIPYSWWPFWRPGVQAKEAPVLFGYRQCGQDVDRVAFGFPGVPDRPVLKGEVGEWRPTGSNNPYGYWVYHREVQSPPVRA